MRPTDLGEHFAPSFCTRACLSPLNPDIVTLHVFIKNQKQTLLIHHTTEEFVQHLKFKLPFRTTWEVPDTTVYKKESQAITCPESSIQYDINQVKKIWYQLQHVGHEPVVDSLIPNSSLSIPMSLLHSPLYHKPLGSIFRYENRTWRTRRFSDRWPLE